jgi:hypothetical protein
MVLAAGIRSGTGSQQLLHGRRASEEQGNLQPPARSAAAQRVLR